MKKSLIVVFVIGLIVVSTLYITLLVILPKSCKPISPILARIYVPVCKISSNLFPDRICFAPTTALSFDEGNCLVNAASMAKNPDKRILLLNQGINSFTQALYENPNDVNIYINRGATYFQIKQYERAIADLNTALQIQPNQDAALHNRAKAYEALGKLPEALADYERELDVLAQQLSMQTRAQRYAEIKAKVKSLQDQLNK